MRAVTVVTMPAEHGVNIAPFRNAAQVVVVNVNIGYHLGGVAGKQGVLRLVAVHGIEFQPLLATELHRIVQQLPLTGGEQNNLMPFLLEQLQGFYGKWELLADLGIFVLYNGPVKIYCYCHLFLFLEPFKQGVFLFLARLFLFSITVTVAIAVAVGITIAVAIAAITVTGTPTDLGTRKDDSHVAQVVALVQLVNMREQAAVQLAAAEDEDIGIHATVHDNGIGQHLHRNAVQKDILVTFPQQFDEFVKTVTAQQFARVRRRRSGGDKVDARLYVFVQHVVVTYSDGKDPAQNYNMFVNGEVTSTAINQALPEVKEDKETGGLTRLSGYINKVRGEEAKISADDSKVQVWVIPTNEELAIARDTLELATK